MLKSLLFVGLIAAVVKTSESTTTTAPDSNSTSEYEKYKVVPDIVDVAPKNKINVVYCKSGVSINNLGDIVTPAQVQDTPTLSYEADENKFYTLTFTDQDAGSFSHWLVGNIPGDHVSQGDTLAEYIGSGPRNGTGLHRYVFLVFQQQGRINFTEPRDHNKSIGNRLSFSVRKFTEKYNLGNPIAGNFYRTEWDEFVPIFFARLTGQ